MPFTGEIIPLSFQLLDGDASKFCRAILTDASGTPLAESPVTMSNIGGGKYSDDTVLMPNIDYVEATYEPYDDAAHTIVDPDHLLGTDVFRLEVPDSVILAKLDEILAKLNGLALPGAAFDVAIVQNGVKEVITDVQVLKSLVERDDIKAIIASEQQSVTVEDNQVIGVIDEC